MHGKDLKVSSSHIALVIASLGLSYTLIFSTLLKSCGVSSLQQVFCRITFSLPTIFLLIKGKFRLRKDDVVHFMLRGMVFSAFLLSALSSIAFGCPVPITTGLVNTRLFFTALIAFIFRQEKTSFKKLLVIFMGIFGAFITSGINLQHISFLNVNFGVFLALLAGFLYALYLFLKRKKKDYSPMQALFNTFLFAAPFTPIFGLILKFFTENPLLIGFIAPNFYQLTLLILITVFSTIMPYTLLNYVNNIEVLPTVEGTILLLDPALHIVWATIILGQYVSQLQYFGIALILLSAFIMLNS